MPKKFTGENSKAVAARAKKASAKAEADERKQKQAEDEYWKDDAKHVVKKQNKKVYAIVFYLNVWFSSTQGNMNLHRQRAI